MFDRKKRLAMFTLGMLIASFSVDAVDTAFWNPYSSEDRWTFLLEHFDDIEGAVNGGRGKAWKGPAAWIQPDPDIFRAGRVSLEAWVKLDKLPEKRAYVIRRKGPRTTTKSFELFVEPSGALGMGIENSQARTKVVSDPGVVATGRWLHLAGISGWNSTRLYINGNRIKRSLFRGGDRRVLPRGKKETKAAAVHVGQDVPGLIDQVRIHRNLTKFWPKPENPWIERVNSKGLPPLEQVLLPDTRPVLHLGFDKGLTPDLNPKEVKVKGEGQLVKDGVLGQAYREKLHIRGQLTTADAGAIEFWSRPQGYSNLLDQNRTILRTNFFNFYFWNSGSGLRPLTLYYWRKVDGRRSLAHARDSLESEVYSGQWYHYVMNWSNGKVSWYVNGQKASATGVNWKGSLNSLSFSLKGFGDVDELYVYDRGLTAVEVANTYWRYVDPTKVEVPREKVANFKFWHLPTSRTLYTQILPAEGTNPDKIPTVVLRDLDGKIVFQSETRFGEEPRQFTLPELDGKYRIAVRVGDKESPPKVLKRFRFSWEGNQLGITNKIYPPFKPVRAEGETVSVVCRDLTMNDFGLWDSVRSLGKEILAAPVRLVAFDREGKKLAWKGDVQSVRAKPHLAEVRAVSSCPAVRVEAHSAVEMDGMMKVTLKLIPVADAVPLNRLSLLIPLKEKVATVMQEAGKHLRAGYSGAIPPLDGAADGRAADTGEVWTSKQTPRGSGWLNAFTSYVWMGGPERGLCWFAENDRGWITAKNREQPLQRIIRSPGTVLLRVDLVNIPGVIETPTELVFGLQATPAKPLPEDFRTKAKTLPSVGLPVHPWGGLSCSWKSPWMDKWEVVDKVVESRRIGGKTDRAFFKEFVEKYDPPPLYGKYPWIKEIGHFTGRWKGPERPDPVYFEEMNVLPFIPEYHVYQDEWSRGRLSDKKYSSVDIYRKGVKVNPNAGVNFSTSYQNYALALMNEWWKRGVSIYWDNTFVRTTGNSWTSAAYRTEDGRIQPAMIYWNERAYLKRTWNLMNHWREKGVARPLEFIVHMTNQNIIPFFSWATCNFDMELSQKRYAKVFPDFYTQGEPFPPAYLQATSMGRQVGNYPYLVHDLFQSSLPADAWGLSKTGIERGRRSWGMRTVHEIISGGPGRLNPYNRCLYQFGYGTGDVKVWNYWEDAPAFAIDKDDVKGLLLTRARDKKMLLVLQSWSKQPVQARVRFDPARIGFAPGTHAQEGVTNQYTTVRDNTLSVDLDFPYATRVFRIRIKPPDPSVVFADDFDDWIQPGWDYVSNFATLSGGRLRIGTNKAGWRGVPRVWKHFNLPSFKDGKLSFNFQIEQVPEGMIDVLSAGFGRGVKWSKHGLSHSYVNGCVGGRLYADPGKGWIWKAGGISKTLGRVDAEPHEVALAVDANGHCTLTMDGTDVCAFTADTAAGPKDGFYIHARRHPERGMGALLLDDVTLRSETADRAGLEARRQQALKRSRLVVAAQVDELKQMILKAFGVSESPALYKLALFRDPEADAAALTKRLTAEEDAGKRTVLFTMLRRLPEEHKEHVQAMKAIGQPAHQDGQFKKARAKALAALEAWEAPKEAEAEKQKTLETLAVRAP